MTTLHALGKTSKIVPIEGVKELTVPDELAKCFRAVVCYKEKFPDIYDGGEYIIEGNYVPYFEVEALLGSPSVTRCFSIKTEGKEITLSPYKSVRRHMATKEEVQDRLEVYMDEMECEDYIIKLTEPMESFYNFTPSPMNTKTMMSSGKDLFKLVLKSGQSMNSFTDEVAEGAALIYLEEDMSIERSIYTSLRATYNLRADFDDEYEEYIKKLLTKFVNPVFLESEIKQFDIVKENEQTNAYGDEVAVTVEENSTETPVLDLQAMLDSSSSPIVDNMLEAEEAVQEETLEEVIEEDTEVEVKEEVNSGIEELTLKAINYECDTNFTKLPNVFNIIETPPESLIDLDVSTLAIVIGNMYENHTVYGAFPDLVPSSFLKYVGKSIENYNGADTFEEAFEKTMFGERDSNAKLSTRLYLEVAEMVKRSAPEGHRVNYNMETLMKINSYMDEHGAQSLQSNKKIEYVSRALGFTTGDIVVLMEHL